MDGWRTIPEADRTYVRGVAYRPDQKALIADHGKHHARFTPISKAEFSHLMNASTGEQFNNRFRDTVSDTTAQGERVDYDNVYAIDVPNLAQMVLTFRSSAKEAGLAVKTAMEKTAALSGTPTRFEQAGYSVNQPSIGPEKYQCSVRLQVGHPIHQQSALRRYVKEQTDAWTVSVQSWARRD